MTVIAFSNGVNLENFVFGAFVSFIYFGVHILNIILRWGEEYKTYEAG